MTRVREQLLMISKQPVDSCLIANDQSLRREYVQLQAAEEWFYKQEACAEWLSPGDQNTE